MPASTQFWQVWLTCSGQKHLYGGQPRTLTTPTSRKEEGSEAHATISGWICFSTRRGRARALLLLSSGLDLQQPEKFVPPPKKNRWRVRSETAARKACSRGE